MSHASSARKTLFKKFKSLDIFGSRISLSYKGEDSYRTMTGATITFAIICVMSFYTAIKVTTLILKQDPYVNSQHNVINIMDEGRKPLYEYKMDVALGFIEVDSFKGVELPPEIGRYRAFLNSINYLEKDIPEEQRKNVTEIPVIPCTENGPFFNNTGVEHMTFLVDNYKA